MGWLEAIKKRLGGAPAPQQAAAPTAKEPPAPEAPEGKGAAALKDLEQKGLLGKFFRHWKNPALLKQLRAVAARMQAEGVNLKDMSAVQAWLKAHQKEIESGGLEGPEAAKPRTFVKSGPEAGRNDPCPCGSGKKYKKCCAAKAK